jgi:hypothetical protein
MRVCSLQTSAMKPVPPGRQRHSTLLPAPSRQIWTGTPHPVVRHTQTAHRSPSRAIQHMHTGPDAVIPSPRNISLPPPRSSATEYSHHHPRWCIVATVTTRAVHDIPATAIRGTTGGMGATLLLGNASFHVQVWRTGSQPSVGKTFLKEPWMTPPASPGCQSSIIICGESTMDLRAILKLGASFPTTWTHRCSAF